MKGLNLIILIAFIAFVIAIVGLTLNFFQVFEEEVFILALHNNTGMVLPLTG